MNDHGFLRYKQALRIAEPLRRAIWFLENEMDEGWGEHWYNWTLKRRLFARVSSVLQIFRALLFLWIARNGEDKWSIWLAAKGTICLLLGLRPRFDGDSANWYNSANVAWFGRHQSPHDPGEEGASAWTDICVGFPGWFAYLQDDSNDCEW